MKKQLTFILLSLLSITLFSQIEYGYERPKSSTDPWKFGITGGVSWDWINQQNGIQKKIGWRAGISGEKHLVYNIYFRPALNFVKKGFLCDIENNFKNDVNAYLVQAELNFELKFGNEYKGRGFLCYFAPFFSYGIGGKSTLTNQNPINPGNPNLPPENYMVPIEYSTFYEDRDKLKNLSFAKEDVGFILGVGYDINHNIELNFNYTLGFINIGAYNNFRWQNLNFSLTYFFSNGKRR